MVIQMTINNSLHALLTEKRLYKTVLIEANEKGALFLSLSTNIVKNRIPCRRAKVNVDNTQRHEQKLFQHEIVAVIFYFFHNLQCFTNIHIVNYWRTLACKNVR